MRIALITLGTLISSVCCNSQITIESSNLPDAGDILLQVPHTLLSAFNTEDTGADYVWTLTEDDILNLGNGTPVNCIDVSSTPIIYQFLFNNPFDQEHNADFAFGVDQFEGGGFTFEDVYAYMQNNDERYAMVGLGATINSIPLPAQSDPVDVIYELPLNFGDGNTSDSELLFEIPTLATYQLVQNRVNDVDGWGTLSILGSSLEVLRVKSTINATDSVYIDALQFGQAIDRPESIEYKWISLVSKVPILQINTTAGIVTGVLIAPMVIDADGDGFTVDVDCNDNNENVYPGNEEIANDGIDQDCDGEDFVSVSEYSTENFYAVYSASNDHLNVFIQNSQQVQIQIFDQTGKLVINSNIVGDENRISTKALSSGQYISILTSESGKVNQSKFVKNN